MSMSRRIGLARAWVLAVLLTALCAGRSFGKFAPGTPAPVDRLIRNIEAYIQEHPKDAQGYYTLGRVHYKAFTLKSQELGTYGEGAGDGTKLPKISDYRSPAQPRTQTPEEPPKPLTEEDLARHVSGAVTAFRKAIELSPKDGLFHQGLGYILEEGAPWACKIPGGDGFPPGDPEAAKLVDPNRSAEQAALIRKLSDTELKVRDEAQAALKAQGAAAVKALSAACRDSTDAQVKSRAEALVTAYWRERAIESYYTAYGLAIAKDLQIKNQPLRGLASLVGYESGQRYVQLVNARGATDAEKEKIAKIQRDLKTLHEKPPGAITPILFSLEGPVPLEKLLAAQGPVKFDLDGTGRGFTWPWVQPATGILVWDGDGKGRIASGHQLFGSVTWDIFWPDGYRALDALDDNRDGRLTGEELRGLAVWFDRNGNGRSDSGEVVPLEKTGILSIRTRPTGKTGDSPFCSDGLRMRDGRVLPTYDWTARPLDK